MKKDAKWRIAMNSVKGFTLIELMIVIVIVGTLVALSSPNFSSSIERQKLVSAAETISTDFQWAKIEAIKRNDSIDIDLVSGNNGAWSYTISDSDGIIRTTAANDYNDFSGISLTQNFTGSDFEIEPARGTVADFGTASLTSPNLDLNVVVSRLGRIRICSPSGIPGYETC